MPKIARSCLERAHYEEDRNVVHADGRFKTDRPARYAAQLAKHLGHRLQTAWEEPSGYIRFPDGTGSCTMQATGDALELTAEATDDAALERLKDVVKRHLERFAEREQLVVDWTTGAPV